MSTVKSAEDSVAPMEAFEPLESSGEESTGSELEMDDFQAKEIRQVFLTTLPDYLEPIQQMVEQLFRGGAGQEDLRKAIVTTLSSIGMAAGRVGIEDVSSIVTRMLSSWESAGAELDDRFRQRTLADLASLTRIAGGQPEAEPGAPPRHQTIVAAFRDIDGSVLERLTAAGVTTVDQLRMAKTDEIMAVTGLGKPIVDSLLASLSLPGAPSRRPSARVLPAPSVQQLAVQQLAVQQPAPVESPPPISVNDPMLAAVPAGGGQDDELGRLLRQQVERELGIDELRGEVLKLQVHTAGLRSKFAKADERSDELKVRLGDVRSRIAERLTELTGLRAHHAALEQRRAEAARRVSAAEERLLALKQARSRIREEEEQLARTVAGLASRVERLVDTAVKAQQGYGSTVLKQGGTDV